MQKSEQLIKAARLKQGVQYARRACVLDEMQCERYYELVTKHKTSTEREARADMCLNAHASQCHEAGRQYALEKPYKYPKSYKLFVRGCKLNEMASCYGAGVMHQNQFLQSSSYLKERQYFKKACDQWYPNACLNLAVNYIRSDQQSDIQKGIKLYDKMCQKGRYLGCVELGTRYINGRDVKEDYDKGMTYLRRACRAQVDAGCKRYADQLAKKAKTENDKKMVIVTYYHSCKYGSNLGCLRTANSAERYGLVLDKKQIKMLRQLALEAFIKECDVKRSGFACWRVGEIYYKGWSSPKSKADAYFKKACSLDKRTCSWDKDE